MFDKLFGKKSPLDSVVSEPEPVVVEEEVTEHDNLPRYRCTVEAYFEREGPYINSQWVGSYRVYDQHNRNKMIGENASYYRSEEAALVGAEEAAKKFVLDQHTIDKGPSKKTFLI